MRAGTGQSPASEGARFLQRQMGAWLLTLSFPAYCALIRLLLMRCGYSTVRAVGTMPPPGVTGRRTGGEGGLDLLAFAHTDMATFLTAVGLRTGRLPLGRRFVDELRGVLGRVGAEQGLLFTTATVSPKTREIAGATGLAPVHIIDGEALAATLIERRIGVRRAPDPDGDGELWQFDARFFEELEAAVRQHQTSLNRQRS